MRGLSHLPKAALTLHGTHSATSASPREKIPDDEKPFDIPESWEWVHINQVAETSLGKTMDKEKNTGDYYPYLCSINVYWDGISLEKVKEARFTVEDKEKYLLKKGDLLICEGGDVGRSAIWNFDKEMYYQNALHRVRFYEGVLPQYFRLMIECYKGLGIIERYCKGVTIKHLVQNSLYAIWFPLPPLAEQKRIVAKIEELLPLIDRYEKAWSKLEDFNKRFPVDMQKSLLQMAIQGKLVEQRAEEGTAAELLRDILTQRRVTAPCGWPQPVGTRPSRAEREPRDAEVGRSPRDRRVSARNGGRGATALPLIPDDEKPFDIPESWEWVRLGDLGSLKSGYAFKSTEYTKDGIQVVRISDLSDDSIGLKDAVFYPQKKELTPYLVVNGSFLICMTGSIGKMAWVKDGVLRYLNQRVGMFIPNALCSSAYLWHFLHTSYVVDGWIRAKTSTNGNIKNSDIVELLIPLPPLAEQKRIVAKLEELLPLCERLK